jgi:shikimate dehydrogenase
MARQIDGKTRLTGLIGWPVSHSLSPAMHNAAAAALGLDLVYLPLAVHPDQLAAAVRGLVALGFLGANVTVPHKEAVLPLLDALDPAAAAIGAVNTIMVSDQWSVDGDQPSAASLQPSAPLLIGHNTDHSGFLAHLSELGVKVGGRESLILGAGGSARAVAYGLATAGSRAHIFARRQEQAQQLGAGLAAHCPPGSLAAHTWPALQEAGAAFPEAALIVNTTPLGMTPNIDRSPWPESAALPKQAFVYDLVYNPAETRLMGQARAAGLKTSNGLGMLLRQGAQAFKLWTGLQPDLNVMAQALQSDP